MDFKEIRQYWERRAAADGSAQATTQDYYLREIECRALQDAFGRFRPGKVIDIGCGDARTTIRLALAFPDTDFLGSDYSSAMIRNAESNIADAAVGNVRVEVRDITQPAARRGFDLVYTTRCLINLPTWESQQRAIAHIHGALSDGGVYVMIENFMEGHDNFNRMRKDFGLPPITVRDHNLFFERPKLIEAIGRMFDVVEEVNISSTYYLVSRVIYSKICQDRSIQPDYFDEHHRYASALPFLGEFGPVRMLCLRKK